MKNVCKIDFVKKCIVMDRTFAKNVENTNSEEYAHLQTVRRDYPNYPVTVRTIKKNTKKKTYKGLDYEYMKDYIIFRSPIGDKDPALKELDDMILISQCQSTGNRYPVIKRWFLAKYPEIAEFGVIPIDSTSNSAGEVQNEADNLLERISA